MSAPTAAADHTSTPWTHMDGPDQTSTVFAGDDRDIVCECLTNGWGTRLQIANAAFIVCACNNHDALVAALRRVVAIIESFEQESLTQYAGWSGALGEARAALAAAGETP